MEKFQFSINAPLLGNPYLEDTFLRSVFQRLFASETHKHSIESDFLLFGERIHTDLRLKANDAEENPPHLKQIDVYGEHINDISTTIGWKLQSVATTEEGLMSIPYPYLDPHGYIQYPLDFNQTPRPSILSQPHDLSTASGLSNISIHNNTESQSNSLQQIVNNIFSTTQTSNIPQRPVYQHHKFTSQTARLHSLFKTLLYTPSGGMHGCPNAMIDGFSRLMTTMFMNPALFGKASTAQPTTPPQTEKMRKQQNQLFSQSTNNLVKFVNSPRIHPSYMLHKSTTSNPSLTSKHDEVNSLFDEIPFDELLLLHISHYALACTTSKTAEDPLSIFQPSYASPLRSVFSQRYLSPSPTSKQQQHRESNPIKINPLQPPPCLPTGITPGNHDTNPFSPVNYRRVLKKKQIDSIPNFASSGQWMTEAKSGSDVGSGTTTLAFPVSFPRSMYPAKMQVADMNSTTTAVLGTYHPSLMPSDRLFALYGLKFFTSAIDSKFTITLARVINATTWGQSVDKLNKKYKTDKFSKVKVPDALQASLVVDPDNNATCDIYSCNGMFEYAHFGPEIRNTINQHTAQPTEIQTQFPLILTTQSSHLLNNLNPHDEVVRNIPLTCFLLMIKNEQYSNSHNISLLNSISVQRMKDKLGTKQLPTAELLMNGTLALRLSEYGKGTSLISLLFNLSRLHNSVSACGYVHRLVMLNRDYMRKRFVFGRYLNENATHLNSLADFTAQHWFISHATLELSFVHGVIESITTFGHYYKQFYLPLLSSSAVTQHNPHIQSFTTQLYQQALSILFDIKHTMHLPSLAQYEKCASISTPNSSQLSSIYTHLLQVDKALSIYLRTTTPVTKLTTAEFSTSLTTQLIQLFGALGYMEDSRIPRMMRDAIVLAIWEGTKQVCAHDFVRSISLPNSHRGEKSVNGFKDHPQFAEINACFEEFAAKTKAGIKGEELWVLFGNSHVIDMNIINVLQNVWLERLSTAQQQLTRLFSSISISDEHEPPQNDSKLFQLIPQQLVSSISKDTGAGVIFGQGDFVTYGLQMISSIIQHLEANWSVFHSFLVKIESPQFFLSTITSTFPQQQSQWENAENKNSNPAYGGVGSNSNETLLSRSIQVSKHAKMAMLEQHCVALSVAMFSTFGLVSLLHHALYFFTKDDLQHNQQHIPQPDAKQTQTQQPSVESEQFFAHLQIPSSYGYSILFACYRLICDSPFATLTRGLDVGANAKANAKASTHHPVSPTIFFSPSQLVGFSDVAEKSFTAGDQIDNNVNLIKTGVFFKHMNSLVARDETTTLNTDHLIKSKL